MRHLLAEAHPAVEVLDGVAERLPLADRSVDAASWVTPSTGSTAPSPSRSSRGCFGPAAGSPWCGTAALETDPPARELDALVEELRARALPESRRNLSRRWREALDEAGDRFAPLRDREWLHHLRLDRDAFVAYVASLAFIAALPSAEGDPALAQVRALTPASCRLELRTECFWTHRA